MYDALFKIMTEKKVEVQNKLIHGVRLGAPVQCMRYGKKVWPYLEK
jgi:hypothetical protein